MIESTNRFRGIEPEQRELDEWFLKLPRERIDSIWIGIEHDLDQSPSERSQSRFESPWSGAVKLGSYLALTFTGWASMSLALWWLFLRVE